jgi:hypothetical protein
VIFEIMTMEKATGSHQPEHQQHLSTRTTQCIQFPIGMSTLKEHAYEHQHRYP